MVCMRTDPQEKREILCSGVCCFELYFDDDKELKAILTPSFLFDWGMRAYTSKFYMDIDYKRCSEIQKELYKAVFVEKDPGKIHL